MSNEFTKLYSPPDFFNYKGERVLGEEQDRKLVEYINSNNDKSKSFLRSNRGWKSAESCMAIFYGDDNEKIPTGLSRVVVKKLRRQTREAIANATNIRPRWEHRSYNDKYPEETQVYDDLRDDWWYGQKIDRRLKGALQFAGGGSTGYLFLWPDYDPATGELEITATPLSWKQVLPYHAGVDATVDSVYGLTVRIEMAVPDAHAKFPKHIDIIRADRNVPDFFARSWSTVVRRWKGVADRMKNRNTPFAQDPYPAVDIFFTWIRDLSTNETGNTLLMGEVGAHYSYNVPSKFDPTFNINKIDSNNVIISSNDPRYAETDANGNSKYRYITDKECRLFPYQRLIISTTSGVIYDGPPLYLNRFRPVVPFKFEEVVGEFLGINLIRDGRRLEESANKMLQALEDSIVGKLSVPIAIDPKLPLSIKQKLSRNVRLLIGKVIEYSPTLMEKAVTQIIPADFFNIDSGAIEILKYNQDMQDYQMGTNDASFLTKMNQMPASDTIDAYLRSLGALSTDYARGFELSMLQVARVWLDFAPQVYTTPRIITKYGAADLVASAADYDPNSIIPQKEDYPNCSYAERWQKHMKNFTIYATPFSLQENISQTNKLTLMTLQKIGVPISNRKLYDTFIPDGKYDLVYKDWIEEQMEKTKIAAELQRQLQAANQQADPMNKLAESAANLVNSNNGNTNQEGRPNSYEKPPTLEQKSNPDGTARSTVATS